jgi:hypothetical protein
MNTHTPKLGEYMLMHKQDGRVWLLQVCELQGPEALLQGVEDVTDSDWRSLGLFEFPEGNMGGVQ